jgi:hypothetical protein
MSGIIGQLGDIRCNTLSCNSKVIIDRKCNLKVNNANINGSLKVNGVVLNPPTQKNKSFTILPNMDAEVIPKPDELYLSYDNVPHSYNFIDAHVENSLKLSVGEFIVIYTFSPVLTSFGGIIWDTTDLHPSSTTNNHMGASMITFICKVSNTYPMYAAYSDYTS